MKEEKLRKPSENYPRPRSASPLKLQQLILRRRRTRILPSQNFADLLLGCTPDIAPHHPNIGKIALLVEKGSVPYRKPRLQPQLILSSSKLSRKPETTWESHYTAISWSFWGVLDANIKSLISISALASDYKGDFGLMFLAVRMRSEYMIEARTHS